MSNRGNGLNDGPRKAVGIIGGCQSAIQASYRQPVEGIGERLQRRDRIADRKERATINCHTHMPRDLNDIH